MQDGIINGNGDSRFLKSAITEATTWEQFKAMLIAGTLPIDLNGINAVGWQQLATALCKATLFSDSTAALLGLPTTAVPNDALIVLFLKGKNSALLRLTIKDTKGNPVVAGIKVNGIVAEDGVSPVYTNEFGFVQGFTTAQNTTVSTQAYKDLASTSKVIATKTGSIVVAEMQLTSEPTSGKANVTSSTIFEFSPYVKSIDFGAVGGGGRGGDGLSSAYTGMSGGGGGGGGEVKNLLNHIPTKNTENRYSITIGAKNGGSTLVSHNNISILVAQGGGTGGYGGDVRAPGGSSASGGSGGFSAGYTGNTLYQAQAGKDGAMLFDGTGPFGAGGGGGGAFERNFASGAPGGNSGGGRGASWSDGGGSSPSAGSAYGAGGGGGAYSAQYATTRTGADGYQGCAVARWVV